MANRGGMRFPLKPYGHLLDKAAPWLPLHRDRVEYETTVTVVGLLGEKPCTFHIRGRGSYDEKYEEMCKS